MNKKILLGSIIAVVILVLVSFTGVVGHQTTTNTFARASPLFSVRSKRAIDEASRDLTCNYVGKGREIALLLPKRESRNVLIQKVIDIISKRDDKELNRLIELVKNKLFYIKSFNENERAKIINIFHHIRNNSQVLTNNDNALNVNSPLFIGLTVNGNWKVGCMFRLALGFSFIIALILVINLWSRWESLIGEAPITFKIVMKVLEITWYIWEQMLSPTSMPTCGCFP